MALFGKKNIASLSDEVLVQFLSTRRSDEALTELHARYSKKVLGFFVRMFRGDIDKAQDFVQDLFLKILEKHHQFDPERKFYTWMFTIASNMCKSEFRKPENVSISSDEYELKDRATWNENKTDKAVFHRQLKHAISKLEPHHREAFVLRHMQGLSIGDIAEITEVSSGTVKSRVFYGTKKIAEALKEFKPGQEGLLFKMN